MNRPITFGLVAQIALTYWLIGQFGTIVGLLVGIVTWPLIVIMWEIVDSGFAKRFFQVLYELKWDLFKLAASLIGCLVCSVGVLLCLKYQDQFPIIKQIFIAIPGMLAGLVFAGWISKKRNFRSRTFTIFLVAIGGIGLSLLIACLDDLTPIDVVIISMSKRVNEELPRQIDSSTRFISTRPDRDTLIGNYVLNYPAKQLKTLHLEESMREKLIGRECIGGIGSELLRKGGKLQYVYSSSDGMEILNLKISQADCLGQAH